MSRLRLAWRVLRAHPGTHQKHAIGAILSEEGVMFGLRIDPAEDGGLRVRSSNPLMLNVIDLLLTDVKAEGRRESSGVSAELVLRQEMSA